MSPATLQTYGTSARQLAAFLADRGMPTTPAGIGREHIEAFISDLLTRWKPATAHNRYRSLRTFFGWLVEEGEIRESPMARMRPPRLPEEPPSVLREPELRGLLEACERDKSFGKRRDEAVPRVFMDTGARRGEVLGLMLDDVDLDDGLLTVTARAAGRGSSHSGDAARPLARQEGAASRIGPGRARQGSRPRGGHPRPTTPAPIPPCLRTLDARGRDAGNRSHGSRGVGAAETWLPGMRRRPAPSAR